MSLFAMFWGFGKTWLAASRAVLLRQRAGVVAAVFLATLAAALSLPGSVSAQADPCNVPGDPDAINSKECVCHGVDDFAYAPMKMTLEADPYASPPNSDGGPVAYDDGRVGTGRPVYDPLSGTWVSHDPVNLPDLSIAPWGVLAEEPADPAGSTVADSERPRYDVVLQTNDRYNELCAFSYFRENMGRLWRFGVALGGVAAAISLAWAGVAYMQDSASYGDAMRVRMAIFRVVIGLAVLALALVIWNVMDAYLISHVDSWSWEQEFYDFRGLHGGSER